ncbi:MAG TPA: DUF2934 domain-containing protein [Steroidobacteraceae bacterium]|nr:DUF2934 domain-containing protein [Steroidobacteraceae bacterium]
MSENVQSAAGLHVRRNNPAEMTDPCPLAAQAWRERMVKEAAYFHFLHRGCGPGRELEDWGAAEREVDAFMFMPTG